jgi:hypothetical protein
MTFEKPLFLTAFSTSLFSVYLLGFILVPSWRSELSRSYKVLFSLDASTFSLFPPSFSYILCSTPSLL